MKSEAQIRDKMRKRGQKTRMKRNFLFFVLVSIFAILILIIFKTSKKIEVSKQELRKEVEVKNELVEVNSNDIEDKKVEDWRLILVNKDNLIPKDYVFELANIDKNRKFDKRAISDLKLMMKEIRKDGITNIWIQSSYRDVKLQEELYNNSIKKYQRQGKTKQEAEKITQIYINKPGSSEHNIGLAVDFNDVKESFENTKAFKWLKDNAKDYGFILRYPKDKENITNISYEPWHWRYVGRENAIEMVEKNLCLEEYIDFKNR